MIALSSHPCPCAAASRAARVPPAPPRAPAPPGCLGRGRARPLRRRAAARLGRAAAAVPGRHAGHGAGPRGAEQRKGGAGAGPAPTAMWGPAVSPPLFYVFIPLFRL